MDTLDAGRKLHEKFKVDLGDATAMAQQEVDDLRADWRPFHPRARRPPYAETVEAAYENIARWLCSDEMGDRVAWRAKGKPHLFAKALAHHVVIHRRAAVWALLIRWSRRRPARRAPSRRR